MHLKCCNKLMANAFEQNVVRYLESFAKYALNRKIRRCGRCGEFFPSYTIDSFMFVFSSVSSTVSLQLFFLTFPF